MAVTRTRIEGTQRAIDILEPYLRDRMVANAGTRIFDDVELRDLTTYWVAALTGIFSQTNGLTGLVPKNLGTMSEGEIIKHFIYGGAGNWTRGIEMYSSMASSRLTELIDSKLEIQGSISLLDIGCGNAYFLRELKAMYGDRIDYYGVSNEQHGGSEQIKFRLGLAELLPLEWTSKFDLVTCFEASMYFLDQCRAFDEALRMVKPGGKLFYGTGALKIGTVNDDLLDERPGFGDFEYTYPPSGSTAGAETVSGPDARYIVNFKSFMKDIKRIKGGQETFSRHGKQFGLNTAKVMAWCSTTLQVSCIDEQKGLSRSLRK